MEIIINKCYGGFGISTKALLLLIERNADCIEKMTVQHYYGGDDSYKGKPAYNSKWKERFDKDFKKERTKEIKPGFFVFGFCNTLTDKEFIYDLKDKYNYNSIRTDPELIKVVKELGKEANGNSAELKIIEIPDGTDFEIDEYDGMESVHEAHESWS